MESRIRLFTSGCPDAQRFLAQEISIRSLWLLLILENSASKLSHSKYQLGHKLTLHLSQSYRPQGPPAAQTLPR